MSIHRRLRPAVAGLIVAVVFAAAPSANHSWGNYHWARTSNPFTLKVGVNLSSDWRPYLDLAVQDWNVSSVLDLSQVAGGTRPKNCRPTSGRIEACNARYGNNGWLGLAQIWVSGSHITQGTAKMNDTYFTTAQYNTPAWRRLVVCQEIAHDFGLDHQDENFDNPNLGTCMDYTSDPDGPPSNVSPNQHDYDQLETIYAHLDSATTIGQRVTGNPAAMDQIEMDTPGQWGRLVRDARRTSLYELDFGHGRKVFTFVIWADDARGRGRVEE